jgi:D-alanyl-D-alanine carboxypeptidase
MNGAVLNRAASAALTIAFVMVGARVAEARTDVRHIAVSELQRELESMKERHGVTALLFGLWLGDREILTQALGTSMTGVPATTDMHFRIGAVSITSLTTVLLQLVDQRVVSLDDTLSRWFPHYPQSESVTLRMLANSSAGYRDYVANEIFVERFHEDVFADWPIDELIALGMEGGPLYQPGTSWNYAHTNFVLLGQVLAEVTGRSVRQLVTENIVERLDLEETRYTTTPKLKRPVLHAFTTERGIFEDSTFWNPSWTSYTGGLTSDLRDLGHLTRALGSGELVSRRAYRAFKAPTTVGLGPNRRDRYYGLGVAVERPWIVQTFSFGGYGGKVGYLPRRRMTMVVVTTLGEQSDPDVSPASAIFDALRQRVERR